MTVIADDWLTKLIDEVRPDLAAGAVSTYLPELGRARFDDLAAAVAMPDGNLLTAGAVDTRFTMQSVVKVFTLLLALHFRGEEHVFTRVGRDQAIGSYNSLETFIRGTGVPVNPFVNAGALVVVDMLPGDRVAEVLEFVRVLTANPAVAVDPSAARSEFVLAERNRALAYFLRSQRLIDSEVDDLLWDYCQMCAIEVDVVDLARAARVLAFGPPAVIGGQVLRTDHVRLVRRLMLFAGMYEASGRYACEVGIPAKCGVSGAMIGVVPQRAGVGVYGPALDECANSIGGLGLMRMLAQALEVE